MHQPRLNGWLRVSVGGGFGKKFESWILNFKTISSIFNRTIDNSFPSIRIQRNSIFALWRRDDDGGWALDHDGKVRSLRNYREVGISSVRKQPFHDETSAHAFPFRMCRRETRFELRFRVQFKAEPRASRHQSVRQRWWGWMGSSRKG